MDAYSPIFHKYDTSSSTVSIGQSFAFIQIVTEHFLGLGEYAQGKRGVEDAEGGYFSSCSMWPAAAPSTSLSTAEMYLYTSSAQAYQAEQWDISEGLPVVSPTLTCSWLSFLPLGP